MAKAKSSRPPEVQNPVITMPDAGSLPAKKSVTPVNSSSMSSSSNDLEGRIRQRAFELYEQRGRTPGMDKEDWFKAEQEVRSNSAARRQSA